MMQGWPLPDRDGGAMRCVVALHGGFLGLAALDRNLLWHAVTTDRFLQKASCSRCIPVLREEKGNGLAVFVHCTRQIPPRALPFDLRLIHPPTHPHRLLAPRERGLQLGAVLDHPPVARGVIDLHPTFLHEFFDMARAQNDLLRKGASLKLIAICVLPLAFPWITEGDHPVNGLK
jgi:hypothetical protein